MEQKLRSGRGALKIRAWGGECSGGEHGECRGPGVGVSWMSLSSKKASQTWLRAAIQSISNGSR